MATTHDLTAAERMSSDELVTLQLDLNCGPS